MANWSGSKSVEALPWSSCLAKPGASWATNFLILFVFGNILAGESMDVVFANLAWNLYWAYLGLHPDRCPKGNLYTTGVDFDNALKPLAGGLFLVLWILRADLEWIVKRLWLSDYRSKTRILCEAGSGPVRLAWTDFREVAPWMRTLWNKLT